MFYITNMMKKHYSFIPRLYLRYKKGPDLNLAPQSIICSKLNTRRIVKTCPFRFLPDYYSHTVDVLFHQFPNRFLPFSMVFPHVSSNVFIISSGVSTVSPVSCFRFYVCLMHVSMVSKLSFHKFPGDSFLSLFAESIPS